MSSLLYSYKAADDDSNYRDENIGITYDRKLVIDREITNAQGQVSISLSGAGTIVAVMIKTDIPLKVNLTTDSFTVGNVFFADSSIPIVSVENEDSENEANITIIAWGTA